MFKVICTGKNLNYGKENESRILNDTHTMAALKKDWIYPDVTYQGDGRPEQRLINLVNKIKEGDE